ncbi:hypothetical protein CDL56_27345 [Escherichia coli]|nr:hypothetical protein CDL56_27345 [Escherichia coli]
MKVTRTDLHRCYSPISFTVIRTEVAVVLKISVELHDKVIGHYLNIKHYQ